MQKNRIAAAALLLTLGLAGCSWDEDVVPAMTGEPAPSEATTAAVTHLPHGGVTPFESTGTAAGEKAADLRAQLGALQDDIDAAYAAAQAGAPQEASAAIDALTSASSTFTTAGARAADLLQQTRDAYNMADVTDADREQLSVLEGEINRTAAVISQTGQEIDAQLAEHKSVLAGAGVAAAASSDLPIAGPVLPAPTLAAGAKPFVVIRFEQPNVPYQSQLATALSQAMQRRPGAMFDVVAVAPTLGGTSDVRRNTRAAQSSAREVLEYMTSVGVPPEKITLSATTNGAATSNEVQIYVR